MFVDITATNPRWEDYCKSFPKRFDMMACVPSVFEERYSWQNLLATKLLKKAGICDGKWVGL